MPAADGSPAPSSTMSFAAEPLIALPPTIGLTAITDLRASASRIPGSVTIGSTET
jgi:hypothetical protein